MSAMLAIGVCACGGVGAAARYICDSYIKALVAGLFAANTISPDCRLLLATGFLGGFSTFSTMMNETVTLLRNGKIACFIGYALASIVVPVMAVACGYWLA